MCGALIFRNGHEVYSRVGDMSRTFNYLFVVINMPTQISHTCLRAGDIFLVTEEQGISFSTTKIPLSACDMYVFRFAHILPFVYKFWTLQSSSKKSTIARE